ncbi:MAG: cupredoxin domain-containing protein [Methanoregula sp.]|nr:MAG: cupredoxin domain-containing protein [Methanoregula sp.]
MRILSLLSISLIGAAVLCAGCMQAAEPVQPQVTPTIGVPAQTVSSLLATTVPTPISQASVSGNTITIKNFAFTPRTMTVKSGSIVRWENQDSAPHRIIFVDKDGRDTTLDSTVLSSAQSWSNKFDKPGTYPYYCKIHPEMTGTVIVE